jgi:hypothetical protein
MDNIPDTAHEEEILQREDFSEKKKRNYGKSLCLYCEGRFFTKNLKLHVKRSCPGKKLLQKNKSEYIGEFNRRRIKFIRTKVLPAVQKQEKDEEDMMRKEQTESQAKSELLEQNKEEEIRKLRQILRKNHVVEKQEIRPSFLPRSDPRSLKGVEWTVRFTGDEPNFFYTI